LTKWIKARKSKCPIGCPRNRNVSFCLQSCWTVAEGLSALKPGAPEVLLNELRDFLRSRLGKHEMISELEIREALPRTPVGKLPKKELYDEINAKAAVSKAAE
jgi:hypothetical protein